MVALGVGPIDWKADLVGHPDLKDCAGAVERNSRQEGGPRQCYPVLIPERRCCDCSVEAVPATAEASLGEGPEEKWPAVAFWQVSRFRSG